MSAKEDDRQWMLKYQNGESEGFEKIYRHFSSRIYGYLKLRLSNSPDVDEVFQKVFMKLHQTREQYDAKFPLGPWIFSICRSTLIDHLRAQTRKAETLVEDFADQASPEQVHEEPSSEIPWASLSAKEQELLRFRYFEELSFEEIGKRLSLSSGNARQLISRAIRKVRSLVQSPDHAPGKKFP